jgi:LPXTG-motif cell wall-anchored protein
MKTFVSLLAITLLEILALIKGVDGTALSLAIAALAGLGGYYIRKKRN